MKLGLLHVTALVLAGLGISLLTGCSSQPAPETKTEMKKAAFGTPPPPEIQAKLNAQGAALAAKAAAGQAAAAHPNTVPPTGTAH